MITTLSLSFSVASVRQALPSVGVLSACAFKMIADVECSICQASAIDDTEFEGLACGCVFHEQCLANYVEQARLSIESMRCPNCRKASDDVHELEQDLLRQHADSLANVVNEETVDVPIAAPANVVNEETVDVPMTRRSRRSSRRSNIQTQAAPTAEAEPAAPTEEGQPEAAHPVPQVEAVQVAAAPAAPSSEVQAPQVEAPEEELQTEDERDERSVGTAISTVPHDGYCFCSLCGNWLDKIQLRLVSKSDAEVWKCKVCLCKVVQLNKVMGGWPTDEFKGLTQEDQVSFMRDIGQMKTIEEVKKYANHALDKYQQQAEYFDNSGEFLPLSVWAQRGFDVDMIEQKTRPCDKQVHPVLGTTYRIHLLKTGNRGEKGWKRSHAIAQAPTAPTVRGQAENDDSSLGGETTPPASPRISPAEERRRAMAEAKAAAAAERQRKLTEQKEAREAEKKAQTWGERDGSS